MSLFSKEQNWTSLMSVTLRNRYKHCYPVCFNCFYWRKLQKVHFGLTFKTVIKTIFRICKTSMSTSTLKEVVQSYLYNHTCTSRQSRDIFMNGKKLRVCNIGANHWLHSRLWLTAKELTVSKVWNQVSASSEYLNTFGISEKFTSSKASSMRYWNVCEFCKHRACSLASFSKAQKQAWDSHRLSHLTFCLMNRLEIEKIWNSFQVSWDWRDQRFVTIRKINSFILWQFLL